MMARGQAGDGALRAVARSLRRTVRRTRHRLRGASVILLYHRVTEGVADPWSLCVSPANFAAQMTVLAARGVRALDALVDDAEPGRRRAPVVTFDDGYADFHEAALPVLRAWDIPATLFVTTGTLDGGREFWWDELERVLAAPALPEALDVDAGGPFAWTFVADGDRRALYHALHQRIGRLSGAARTRVLDVLAAWAGVAPACRATHRPLVAAEVATIAREARIAIGAHSVSHAYLGALPSDEQEREIVESKRTLEAITGRALRHFSYPHGDHEPETVEAVRRAGFASACGTSCEPVHSGLFGDVRFDLPRVEVPNLPGPAFARWLDEWVG